jgi:glycosyltransferase involved in cell wall biosynthesis
LTLDVSIVIPTYNQKPRYLREAIESALNQSYPRKRFEILVVDDGSAKTPPDSVVAQFSQSGVILVKKRHGGPADTLNAGIRTMTGKYFKWLSSDDALCEDALETLMSKVDEHSVVYGDWARIDQNSNFIDVYHEPTFSNVNEMKKHLWKIYFGNASASLIPRSAFAKVGMFDPSWPYYEDYDWWLRAVFLYDYSFVHVDRIIAKYRVHVGQLTLQGGGKPLVKWRIKKRVYSMREAFSSFGYISEPTIHALITQMFFSEAADLYRTLLRHNSPPPFLKSIKRKLTAP